MFTRTERLTLVGLVGAGFMGSSDFSILNVALPEATTTFGEGPRRDRVLGLNGALLSAGFSVGALVGGALVSVLGWRAAFLVNLPVAALILVVTPCWSARPPSRTACGSTCQERSPSVSACSPSPTRSSRPSCS